MAIRTIEQLANELERIAEELDTNYGPLLARNDYQTYDALNSLDEFIVRLRRYFV